MNVYPIPGGVASQYIGYGRALAAVDGGRVSRLVYLAEVAPATSDAMRKAKGAQADFFLNQWLLTEEATSIIRSLRAEGEVKIGLCVCWEFCEARNALPRTLLAAETLVQRCVQRVKRLVTI